MLIYAEIVNPFLFEQAHSVVVRSLGAASLKTMGYVDVAFEVSSTVHMDQALSDLLGSISMRNARCPLNNFFLTTRSFDQVETEHNSRRQRPVYLSTYSTRHPRINAVGLEHCHFHGVTPARHADHSRSHAAIFTGVEVPSHRCSLSGMSRGVLLGPCSLCIFSSSSENSRAGK